MKAIGPMNLTGFKTKAGSLVIEKVQLSENKYKWKVICGKCKKIYLSTKRILTDAKKIGLCVSCVRIQTSPNRLNLEGERIGRWQVVIQAEERNKHGSVMYECICDCGQMRFVSATCLNAGKSKSCGCLQIDISKSLHGEKSHCWKGGVSEERRDLERYDRKTHILRKYIYKRDIYTCAVCNSRKRPIAHHMNAWGTFPEQRYEELNLITLCEVHHKLFHKLYGNGGNTTGQFIDFYNTFNLEISFSEVFDKITKYKNINGFEKTLVDCEEIL